MPDRRTRGSIFWFCFKPRHSCVSRLWIAPFLSWGPSLPCNWSSEGTQIGHFEQCSSLLNKAVFKQFKPSKLDNAARLLKCRQSDRYANCLCVPTGLQVCFSQRKSKIGNLSSTRCARPENRFHTFVHSNYLIYSLYWSMPASAALSVEVKCPWPRWSLERRLSL